MYRVIYVEAPREERAGLFDRMKSSFESQQRSRQRLAEEMERIGGEMQRRGLRLIEVTPAVGGNNTSWVTTDGVWMHFASGEAN